MSPITKRNLTASQENVLQEFKQNMSAELDEFKTYEKTFTAYRFLKARNWDQQKAEVMLKKCTQWRRENDITAFFAQYEPPEVLRKYMENFHLGTDKESCPVFYAPIGKFDVKGIFKSTEPIELDKTLSQMFEFFENHIERKSEEEDRWLSGVVYIFDCSGLTFANCTNRKALDIFRNFFKFQQDNAPERLKAAHICNVPSFFSIAFNIIKACLSSDTVNKINVYGSEGWKEELLKVIDADELPVFLGGTRTDPDGNPLCKTMACQFGKVDESYYLDRTFNPFARSPGVVTLHVFRSSSSKIPVEVAEAGSAVAWEFSVRNGGDIGFGLFFCRGAEEAEVKVPLERLTPKEIVESGKCKIDQPGNYFVLFDNTYSWFRSKELFYRIKVLSPKDMQCEIR